MCRRTRQILAYAIGDRSQQTCRILWKRIPASYKSCQSFSDLWEAYQLIFPSDTHQCVGKGERQINHIERWYNRLRQSNVRFVRKTLSFSKSDTMHEMLLACSLSNITYHLLVNHYPILDDIEVLFPNVQIGFLNSSPNPQSYALTSGCGDRRAPTN